MTTGVAALAIAVAPREAGASGHASAAVTAREAVDRIARARRAVNGKSEAIARRATPATVRAAIDHAASTVATGRAVGATVVRGAVRRVAAKRE